MLEAFLDGLGLIFVWPAIGYLFLGVLVGIWIGAVPGLGGVTGLVLLLPFTFGMDPVSAFALLLGMYAVTTTSDTIPSIMLGIPGTASSQATIVDGYPLAQKGQSARALGAALTVSAFGGVFGAVMLALSLPIILPVILAFNSPELFMLALLGLAMVGSLSGASVTKGLTVALLGLLLSTIGYADTVAFPRFTFGSYYLIDGLPLIPVVLGLFGIPAVLDLAVRNVSISRIPQEQVKGGGMLDGIKDAYRHRWLATRCAFIGSYVGILPGLGASIVDWLAYGHAVQSAKDKSQFGRGDIRGVIAPEAANNATRGGALIPTVAFGIPGNIGAAILLGALLIQGLRPGPDMLTVNLDLTFSMVWSIVIANIAVVVALMILGRQIAKVAFVPGHLIVPGVMLFVLMGAWLSGTSMGDWIACIVAGLVGYVMQRAGWPRPPLVLALILGGLMENSYQISVRAHQGFDWIYRPIVLIIFALIVLTIVLSARGIINTRRSGGGPTAGEGTERNPLLSLMVTLSLLVVFGGAYLMAEDWLRTVRRFPVTIAAPAFLLTLVVLFHDTRAARSAIGRAGRLGEALRAASEAAALPRMLVFFAYLAALVVGAFLIGQKLALPLFLIAYLRRWGGYGWTLSIGYALGGWTILVLLYDRVLHVFWEPSWLASWLPGVLPRWLPSWLFV